MSWVPERICSSPAFPPWAVVDLEPFVAEQDAQGIEDSRFVVDHQDRRLLSHAASSAIILAGRKIVNVVPAPGAESTSTRPRCASTARCTIARPSPLPPGPAGDERVEQPLPDLLGDARPVVPDLQPDGVLQIGAVGNLSRLHRRDADRDLDRTASRLDRVQHQVGDDPVQQVLVAVEDRPSALDHELGVGPAVGVGADQANDRRDDRMQVERHELGRAHPGEIQELAQQPAQPVALPHDQPGEEALVLVGMLRPGELLDRAPDRGQRVPDLVRQRRAQRRHRLQPLGPGVELLHFLEVGDVGEDRGHRRRLLGLLPEGGGTEADGEHPARPGAGPCPRLG